MRTALFAVFILFLGHRVSSEVYIGENPQKINGLIKAANGTLIPVSGVADTIEIIDLQYGGTDNSSGVDVNIIVSDLDGSDSAVIPLQSGSSSNDGSNSGSSLPANMFGSSSNAPASGSYQPYQGSQQLWSNSAPENANTANLYGSALNQPQPFNPPPASSFIALDGQLGPVNQQPSINTGSNNPQTPDLQSILRNLNLNNLIPNSAYGPVSPYSNVDTSQPDLSSNSINLPDESDSPFSGPKIPISDNPDPISMIKNMFNSLPGVSSSPLLNMFNGSTSPLDAFSNMFNSTNSPYASLLNQYANSDAAKQYSSQLNNMIQNMTNMFGNSTPNGFGSLNSFIDPLNITNLLRQYGAQSGVNPLQGMLSNMSNLFGSTNNPFDFTDDSNPLHSLLRNYTNSFTMANPFSSIFSAPADDSNPNSNSFTNLFNTTSPFDFTSLDPTGFGKNLLNNVLNNMSDIFTTGPHNGMSSSFQDLLNNMPNVFGNTPTNGDDSSSPFGKNQFSDMINNMANMFTSNANGLNNQYSGTQAPSLNLDSIQKMMNNMLSSPNGFSNFFSSPNNAFDLNSILNQYKTNMNSDNSPTNSVNNLMNSITNMFRNNANNPTQTSWNNFFNQQSSPNNPFSSFLNANSGNTGSSTSFDSAINNFMKYFNKQNGGLSGNNPFSSTQATPNNPFSSFLNANSGNTGSSTSFDSAINNFMKYFNKQNGGLSGSNPFSSTQATPNNPFTNMNNMWSTGASTPNAPVNDYNPFYRSAPITTSTEKPPSFNDILNQLPFMQSKNFGNNEKSSSPNNPYFNVNNLFKSGDPSSTGFFSAPFLSGTANDFTKNILQNMLNGQTNLPDWDVSSILDNIKNSTGFDPRVFVTLSQQPLNISDLMNNNPLLNQIMQSLPQMMQNLNTQMTPDVINQMMNSLSNFTDPTSMFTNFLPSDLTNDPIFSEITKLMGQDQPWNSDTINSNPMFQIMQNSTQNMPDFISQMMNGLNFTDPSSMFTSFLPSDIANDPIFSSLKSSMNQIMKNPSNISNTMSVMDDMVNHLKNISGFTTFNFTDPSSSFIFTTNIPGLNSTNSTILNQIKQLMQNSSSFADVQNSVNKIIDQFMNTNSFGFSPFTNVTDPWSTMNPMMNNFTSQLFNHFNQMNSMLSNIMNKLVNTSSQDSADPWSSLNPMLNNFTSQFYNNFTQMNSSLIDNINQINKNLANLINNPNSDPISNINGMLQNLTQMMLNMTKPLNTGAPMAQDVLIDQEDPFTEFDYPMDEPYEDNNSSSTVSPPSSGASSVTNKMQYLILASLLGIFGAKMSL